MIENKKRHTATSHVCRDSHSGRFISVHTKKQTATNRSVPLPARKATSEFIKRYGEALRKLEKY